MRRRGERGIWEERGGRGREREGGREREEKGGWKGGVR